MIQSAKNEVFGLYIEFGLLDRLDIAYYDGTKCFLTFGNVLPGHAESFKITKMHIWMIQRAKKEGFGHFLDFGLLDRLDIA